jgi:16S rRNA (cytosine1402-N4)-methyltransferase
VSAAHIPVLLDEAMAALEPLAGATLVDGTLGGGGYARAALARGAARVFAFDRDPGAIAAAWAWAAAEPRLALLGERYAAMDRALAADGVARVDAVALDLGVSSTQLDQAARGFSFQADGPLDMRMSGEGPSAADFVNTADEPEIARVLRDLGEERHARRVARAIVAARPLATTGELAAAVRRALGHRPGAPRDPATRAFQAIRIHVNDELGELARGLDAAERLLAPGGRLAVVSFHSLEDRIVKAFLRARSGGEAGGSRHLPERPAPARPPSFEPPARPVRPSDAEIARNPRARSATLRAARRNANPAWSQP